MQTDYKSIVDTVNKAFEDNDTEAFLACCDENMQWIVPGSDVYNGKENIRQMIKNFSCDPSKFTIIELISEGDLVMCRGSMQMKDDTGNYADYAFCDVYHFKEQKIDELTSYIIKQKH